MPDSLVTSGMSPSGGKSPSALGGIVTIAGAIVAGLLAAVSVNATPRDPARVAAIFPPWWSAAESVSAAGSVGQIAAVGSAPFIVILRGDPADLAQRARSAGALLVLDPDLAGVCAPKEVLS
jgi:hypothetical protein